MDTDATIGRYRLCIVLILGGIIWQIHPILAAFQDGDGDRSYVNSIGVTLPPDAAPPEQQVVREFAEDLPYNEWFRSNYKSTPGKYLTGEPLTRVDRNFDLQGSAAASWSVSENGLIWTFVIRPGLRWSDGRSLTAHDYVFSLRRAANPDNAYDFEWYYQPIKNWADIVARRKPLTELGVRAVDDLTLTVTTETPKPYLPLLLTYSWVSPQHGIEKYGDAWSTNPETSVSSGPFMLTEWSKGSRMVLEANPMYTGIYKPYLEKKIFKLTNSTTPPQILPSYEADEIDFGELNNQAELARILTDPDLEDQVYTFPDFSTYYLFFNTQIPPFNDLRVRRAFAHSIDREALCRSALRGFAIPAYSMLPPGFPAYNGDEISKFQRYDPDLARHLFAEAGYPDGKGFPVTGMWLRNETVMARNAAEGVQALLKRNLGVEVVIRNLEAKIFMDGLNNHTTPLGLVPYEFDYVDPSNLLGLWMASGRHNWNNRMFDELMTQGNAEVRDPAYRITRYQQAERILVEEVGGVFLWHRQKAQIWKPYIKGEALKPNRFGYRAWRGDRLNTSLSLYVTNGRRNQVNTR